MQKMKFSIDIQAAPALVWETMLGDAGYRDWTSAFGEGSYFVGSWEQGTEMRFLAPSGGGMAAVIAENRPNAFLSIKHVGMVKEDGTVDTESEEVRQWAPVFENYRFVPVGEATVVEVEMDAMGACDGFLGEAWPKALDRLKALCEGTA